MLFDYTYLLKDFDADFFNDNKNLQISEFIIPINDKIIGRKPELFQILFNSKNRFCFYISLELSQRSNKFIKEEIIQNLIRFLFLPNYMRVNGEYVFFIEKIGEENTSLDLLKTEFYRDLKKQGINDIIFETLQSGLAFQNPSNVKSISLIHSELNNYLNNGNKEESFETFTKKFVFPRNFQKRWIVPVADPDDFQHKIKLIEKFENWIGLTNPFNVQLIEMYKLTNRDSTTLASENKILKFKLENSAYSLKLIREESYRFIKEISSLRIEIDRLAGQINNPATYFPTQASHSLDNEELIMQLRTQINAEQKRANEILAWYRKEYDVLPMWYKKFGHIIKVFTGKRTFRSLFK